MLGIILNIIATLLLILSLIYIRKTCKKELDIYEEIVRIEDNIKDYSIATKDLLNNFDKLLGESLDKLDSLGLDGNLAMPKGQDERSRDQGPRPNNRLEEQEAKILVYKEETGGEEEKPNYSEIIQLREKGMSSEEIARKLDIGIREVEVFLRISNIR